MKLDIYGYDSTIKTRDLIDFTLKPDGVVGKLMKVEKPYIVLLKVDPWNSELHQFETKEEAGEFISSVAK
jgi:hypothetical protein